MVAGSGGEIMREKRILIQECDENPCLSCTNDCKYPCEAKREWVLGAGIKGPKKNYKRSEAVQIIAKAIYEEMCPNFSQMFVGWRAYTKIAESALSALLGVHDDK